MNRLIFPRAFAFAIDDLGWIEGNNLTLNNPSGPYRAGVKRRFDLQDYKSIVEVGKQVGVRIQSLFVLSEWDKDNVLARYPTTTFQRSNWRNASIQNADTDSIAAYISKEAAYIEFGLHGTGHEHWPVDGKQYRAEWYNLEERSPWPEDILRGHLDACSKIMAQYGFSTANGHSFPESFVPCAYSYYWNPRGDYSLGKLLKEAGVRFANTDFSQIPELSPPAEVNGGGFDYGVHVINRMQYGNDWFEMASLPKVPIYLQYTDVIESHWPNWLAQDDFLQPQVTAGWVDYYRHVQRTPDRYIARNTEQLHAQWLYKKYCTVQEVQPGLIHIDNTAMPGEAYKNKAVGNLVLKVRLEKDEHISSVHLNGKPVPLFFRDENFGFLYLPPLGNDKYEVRYVINGDKSEAHVTSIGTGNVYDLTDKDGALSLTLRAYGTQCISVKCKKPTEVVSESPGIIIRDQQYFEGKGQLDIQLETIDFQGVTGTVLIRH